MTDFKGFNPDKNLGANFQPNRQAKSQKAETNLPAEESQTPVDPYADLKMDPSRMMDLLAAQGKPNQIQVAGAGAAHHIEMAMESFSSQISPERHSLTSRLLEQTYQHEFGAKPAAGILQDILDDYLIGQPVIQTS
ncbi:hypothetical protein [Vampirovibrio sp.]|uniref:hypothetical protein n=1 Tax=Vampirovibrio sp. TaxID=2717857 RepID=UPI0035948CF1